MQVGEIKVKARIFGDGSRKRWWSFNNKRVIVIKGAWDAEELRQLLGRLK